MSFRAIIACYLSIGTVLSMPACKDAEIAPPSPALDCAGDKGRECVLEGVVKQNGGDYTGAMVYYDATCAAGVADGCVMAANILRYGLGKVKQDEALALQNYQKACKENHPGGCHHLGGAYRTATLGAAKDLHRARALLKKACDGGEAAACAELADLRNKGR